MGMIDGDFSHLYARKIFICFALANHGFAIKRYLGGVMKKIWIACMMLVGFASIAHAGIEDRGEAVRKQVQGKHDYHASLARELASIAEDEKGQHEVGVASAFMNEAEKHANMAGGK